MSESTNAAQAGSVSAQPSMTLDTAKHLDIDFGNDEEIVQQSNPVEATQADEATEALEPDDTEFHGEESEGDKVEVEGSEEPEDDVFVTMDDGTELALSELKKGHLRQADYQRKTQEVANQKKEVEAKASLISAQENAILQQNQQLQATLDGLATYLARKVPAEPDVSLAQYDPAEYTRQKAAYEAGIREIETILSAKNNITQQGAQLTQKQFEERLMNEKSKLIEKFPQISNPQKYDEFSKSVYETGRKFGFSDSELDGFIDNRFIEVAYYAGIGKRAVEQQKAAKKKISQAPTMPVGVRRQVVVSKNKEAMQRLSKSGSIKDALAIDWE